MNIGKKLYLSFGGVLTTVVILAAVILFAVYGSANQSCGPAVHGHDPGHLVGPL